MQQQSLSPFYDYAQIQCLNEAEGHKAKDFLKSQGISEITLKSDSDEQLLLIIPFNCSVKIQSLILEGPDGFAPSKLKLWCNQPSMHFEDTSSLPCAQELTLTKAQTEKGKSTVIPLKYVKFQNVQSLSIFIESNHGGKDVTELSKFDLLGQQIVVEGKKMDASSAPAFSRVSATELLKDQE